MASTTTARPTLRVPALRATSTAVVVPSIPAGSRGSWRRLVQSIDANAQGAFALCGQRLDAGIAYDVPVGALILAVDKFADHRDVQLLRAADADLEPVKTWQVKAPLGKRVVDFVARRLPDGSQRLEARRLDAVPNRWDSWCRSCRNPVPAGTGRVLWDDGAYRFRVYHHPGQCPPPPPPPPVITPNRYSGLCCLCGIWMYPGEGVALLRDTLDVISGSRYQPAHSPACPAEGLPGPRNRVGGCCAECGLLVAPGDGYWLLHTERAMVHADCPAGLTGPRWVIRARFDEDGYEAGQVRRVRLDLRHGGMDVPMDVPGRRVLSPTYIELIGVVDQVVDGARGRQWAQIRAATAAEAVDLLAEDVQAALLVAPDGGAFPARFGAERRYRVVQPGEMRRVPLLGWTVQVPRGIAVDPPWLAEITGRDPDYRYTRQFLRGDQDWQRASSSGKRGVVYYWTLQPGRVYEASYQVSPRRRERVFLRATADGDVAEISREEVEAWLTHAPVWHAH